jgi:hypothetical protein
LALQSLSGISPFTWELKMPHSIKHGNDTEESPGQSQDALRHRQDAAHHKVHKSPQSDATDTEAGQQPEIPKVGSLDAPGG